MLPRALAALTIGGAVIVTAFAPTRAPAPGEWTLVLDRPVLGKYEDVAFPDSMHGWVVDARGGIVHTRDGGRTWTQQASGLGSLRSVEGLDGRRAFAGTLSGKLYATTDGGSTWTDITSRLPHVPRGFCGMAHRGDTVHVVGIYAGPADYFISTDAGRSWSSVDVRSQARGLVDVEFLDDSIGLIAGSGPPSADGGASTGIILRTADGGRSWRPVFQGTVARSIVWKLFVVSSTTVYAAIEDHDGTFRVARTTDRGLTWHTMVAATGRGNAAVQGVGFVDGGTGWIGGFFRGMYMTADTGRTWTPVPVAASTFNRYARAGSALVTAGSAGIFRYEPRR
jgi:photosystem II stability/assembly factor-like uncharacterized protein